MKTYLDTSALVKLVVEERESTALQTYLRELATDTLFTAALARTELIRAVLTAGPAVTTQARRLLGEIDTINITRSLLDTAADLQPPQLRTLDAIHVAAAQRAGTDLRAVLTYDTRMATAATNLGMTALSPGALPV